MICNQCQQPFTPNRKTQRTCSADACQKSRHAKSVAEYGKKHYVKKRKPGPCLSALLEESKPGQCIICDTLSTRQVCDDRECRSIYENAIRRDRAIAEGRNPRNLAKQRDLNLTIARRRNLGESYESIAGDVGLSVDAITHRVYRLRKTGAIPDSVRY